MKNLHDIIQKNIESFDETFVEMHPMYGQDSHNPPTLHYTDLEKVEEIKAFLLSSQLSIIQAIDEWAEKNNYEAHVSANGSNYLDGADHDVVSLSDLRSFLEEAITKLK